MPIETRINDEAVEPGRGATTSSFLHTLRSRWLLVLLTPLVAATAAYFVSVMALPTVYRSTATVIVHNKPATVPAGTLPVDPFVDDQSLGETFKQLAVQPAVTEQVARDLGMLPKAVTDHVTVQSLPRTPLVVISFDAATPGLASRGAQAYAAQFVQSTASATDLPGTALVVSGATRPLEPIAPRTLLNTVVAGLAGLLLALGVLFRRVATVPTPAVSSDETVAGLRSALVEWHPTASVVKVGHSGDDRPRHGSTRSRDRGETRFDPTELKAEHRNGQREDA
jgi:capsular polysaccharide biosynthesis protein